MLWIPIVLQIILILVLININNKSLKLELLNEYDKNLTEMNRNLPEIISNQIEKKHVKKDLLLPYLPYLTKEMYGKLEEIPSWITKEDINRYNEGIEKHMDFVFKFDMLILNKRMDIQNQKLDLSLFEYPFIKSGKKIRKLFKK